MAEAFVSQDRAFFTPAFRLTLNGQDVSADVMGDVQSVSFTDTVTGIDSFEFVLNDWDPVALRPKYSSPWDQDGKPLTNPNGGARIPDFEPGAKVSLKLGYLEEGDLPLIMEGEVVSIAPSFPASGTPTCRVRALNAFLRGLQTTQVEGTFKGNDQEVVDALCQRNRIQVEWGMDPDTAKGKDSVEVDGTLYDEISKRAKTYGLAVMTNPPTGEVAKSKLLLTQPSKQNDTPVAEFTWGQTLLSFSPALSTAGQVAQVTVRGEDPSKRGKDRKITVTKGWQDINLAADALGPRGTAPLDQAAKGITKVLRRPDVKSKEDAEKAALAELRKMASTLITGAGSSIGLPTLRAGRTVKMAGMGARFDGIYRVTGTTHALGAGGYTTSFQVRKEVLDG